MILIDRNSMRLRKFRVSPEGYLYISARIARTGIQDYFGHELSGVSDAVDPDRIYKVYRSPKYVFDHETLESFAGLPITLGHPDQAVDSSNYKSLSVGHIVGTPVKDADFVRAELTIRDAETIEAINNGQSIELSVGYLADVEIQAGVTSTGETYDAIQRNIRGNHIALVDAARCGPECRLGDQQIHSCNCASCQKHKEQEMSEFVTLDGEQVPLAEAVKKLKDANQRIAEALKDAEATIKNLSSDLESKTGELEAMKAEPTQDHDFQARVQARAKILTEARHILGNGAGMSEQSDTDIRRRVIDHIYGDGFAKGASDHALLGMYRVALRDAVKSEDSLNGRISISNSNTKRHLAEARRNQRLASAWQKGA